MFKDFENGIYQPVLSEIVAFEIENAPLKVVEKYFELLNYRAEIIDLTQEVTQLANVYLDRQILTPKYLDDARHIALATVYRVDMLVSWNFRHLVHIDKMRRFNAVNLELGYNVIEIHSPREVTTYGT